MNSDLAHFSAQALINNKKTQKISNSNIKKFLTFSEEKASFIFRETKTPKKISNIFSSESQKKFFIFQETVLSCSLGSTLNAEIVGPRKYHVHLMSHKILRDLLDIFYTRHLVFHHCATLTERDFFFNRNLFYAVSQILTYKFVNV